MGTSLWEELQNSSIKYVPKFVNIYCWIKRVKEENDEDSGKIK